MSCRSSGSPVAGPTPCIPRAETVNLVALEPRIFFVRHLRKALARSLAERLPFFRRVDAGEADLVLLFLRVEHRDRVTVGDADDAALNDPRVTRRHSERGRKNQPK